ncbi:MAG: inorganic pyrophosphatase [Chloroflexota bacterium]|nr:inorganic pyrophosphatase [Chloroflexota bacterium]MDQ5866610.1 inorganic pyrophosphatase [Chloroflexota bacterium]
MQDERFWRALDQLASRHPVVVDRAKGTPHPRYPDFSYPLDYGYLQGTMSGDGAGVDVWLGSLPGSAVTGVVCCVDAVKGDVEMKLLLGCTEAEMRQVLGIHNDGGQSAILMVRPGDR